MFETPVLFIIFNRPETTLLVFEQIKKIKPKYLYVAADGPRIHKPEEENLCNAARQIITNGIDWDCEIKTLFREDNAGCRNAVSCAINWFFENVENGIILEDDCLPDLTFFYFCKEMLCNYKDDNNIIAINGCNFNYFNRNKESYFFSRFMNVWGWATWRRSAKMIDYNISTWDKKNKLFFLWKKLRNNLFDLDLNWYRYWQNNFDDIFSKKLNTWDYQWQYYQWISNKKTIVASKSLVINIGFGINATHTFLKDHSAAKLKLEEIIFPLVKPVSKKINLKYEEEAIKPIWHLYKRKDNLFYFLNYVNTRSIIQFFRKALKLNK